MVFDVQIIYARNFILKKWEVGKLADKDLNFVVFDVHSDADIIHSSVIYKTRHRQTNSIVSSVGKESVLETHGERGNRIRF